MTPDCFLLGGERSGSTWLANILDANRGAMVMMEPFAVWSGLFPTFPPRNVYLSEGDELMDEVRRDLDALADAKYRFLYRPGRPRVAVAADRLIVRGFEAAAKLSRTEIPQSVAQFRLLNLNARNLSVRGYPLTNRGATFVVIKDLRLNFKVRFLRKLAPAARFVVAIRHPGAQIASIERLVEQGNLLELNESLPGLEERIRDTPRLEKYSAAYDALADRSVTSRLAAWWVANYDCLLQDLADTGAAYRVVYHEEIARDPITAAGELSEFLGVPMSPEVVEYVRSSSSSQEIGANGPMDTARDSAAYVASRLRTVDARINEMLDAVFARVPDLRPELDRYRVRA